VVERKEKRDMHQQLYFLALLALLVRALLRVPIAGAAEDLVSDAFTAFAAPAEAAASAPGVLSALASLLVLAEELAAAMPFSIIMSPSVEITPPVIVASSELIKRSVTRVRLTT
jgi:hypothetical protein